MRCTRSFAWVFAALAVVLPGPLEAAVLGLREAHESFYVAVRGVVERGTVISGIQFYSNDATTLPEVLLAADANGGRLPSPGATLRSTSSVSVSSGLAVVNLTPYEVPSSQYLWAILRFPADQILHAAGSGGGPGIGWRTQRALDAERSLYSIDGSLNEFSPAFSIDLVMSGGNQQASKTTIADDEKKQAAVFQVLPYMQPGVGIRFVVQTPRKAKLHLELFSVAGNRVTQLVDRSLDPGTHEFKWLGTDSRGRRVARGIYLYRVSLGNERRTGKVVLLF